MGKSREGCAEGAKRKWVSPVFVKTAVPMAEMPRTYILSEGSNLNTS